MTYLQFIAIVALGSLIFNYAGFVRFSGALSKNPRACDALLAGLVLFTTGIAIYICGVAVGVGTNDEMWKLASVGFVALVYLVLTVRGVSEYWVLRARTTLSESQGRGSGH